MALQFHRNYIAQLDLIKDSLFCRNDISLRTIQRFLDNIDNTLNSVHEFRVLCSPYAFIIIDNSANSLFKDIFSVYKEEIKLTARERYVLFYCEHINNNGDIDIIALCLYVLSNSIDIDINLNEPIFGMSGLIRDEERRKLINKVRLSGYKLPDNSERRLIIARALYCYEHHLRIPLRVRESLMRRGYRIVEGRVLDRYGQVISE